MTTTYDLSTRSIVDLVEMLIAVDDELIARGQPARDIAADWGVASIEELRGIAAAYDRARAANGGTDRAVVRITVSPDAAGDYALTNEPGTESQL
jgi:hypothetical protein